MRRPRKLVAVALTAAAAALGAWWLVRAPGVERQAVVTPPEIDIDPPPMRARREALVALATMPDDPWTFAESLGASTAGASAPLSRCGVDQRPSLPGQRAASDAADGQADRPAGPAYRAELARMDAALRASSDAFDNAVADWMNVAEADAPAPSVEAVAHRALATSDPRVYGLAYRACHLNDWRGEASPADAPDCGVLSARRWGELDPGNGVPWMYVFTQATAAGDRGAQDEALARMASAARFDDKLYDAAAAIASHVSTDEQGLAADLDLSAAAFQKSVNQNESFNALMDACKDKAAGDANRAQQCEAIGARMFDHGDNLLLQAMGGAVVLRATGDPARRDKGRAERLAMSRAWSPATGLSDCGVVRDGLKSTLRNAQVGELAAARERVTSMNMP